MTTTARRRDRRRPEDWRDALAAVEFVTPPEPPRRRTKATRTENRIVGKPPRLARMGDVIGRGVPGRHQVIARAGRKLLIIDEHGDRFVIVAERVERLGSPWGFVG